MRPNFFEQNRVPNNNINDEYSNSPSEETKNEDLNHNLNPNNNPNLRHFVNPELVDGLEPEPAIRLNPFVQSLLRDGNNQNRVLLQNLNDLEGDDSEEDDLEGGGNNHQNAQNQNHAQNPNPLQNNSTSRITR